MGGTADLRRPEAAALRRFALFAGVGAEALERIRRGMRLHVVGPGCEIIAQGVEDRGDVYFMISGRAEVAMASVEGTSVWIGGLGAGEVFGDLEAIEAIPRDAEVRAVRACRLAVMSRAAFLEAVTGTPEAALGMMRVLAGRLRRQNRRYLEKSALDLPDRIGAELTRRAVEREGVWVVDPAPGPSELARAVGARRETVSRAMARLARAGTVRREGTLLVLADRRALLEGGR